MADGAPGYLRNGRGDVGSTGMGGSALRPESITMNAYRSTSTIRSSRWPLQERFMSLKPLRTPISLHFTDATPFSSRRGRRFFKVTKKLEVSKPSLGLHVVERSNHTSLIFIASRSAEVYSMPLKVPERA